MFAFRRLAVRCLLLAAVVAAAPLAAAGVAYCRCPWGRLLNAVEGPLAQAVWPNIQLQLSQCGPAPCSAPFHLAALALFFAHLHMEVVVLVVLVVFLDLGIGHYLKICVHLRLNL